MAADPKKLDAAMKARQRRNAIEKGDKRKAAQYTQEYNQMVEGSGWARGTDTSGFADNPYWDRESRQYVEPESISKQVHENPSNQLKSLNSGNAKGNSWWDDLVNGFNDWAKQNASIASANANAQIEGAQEIAGTLASGVKHAVENPSAAPSTSPGVAYGGESTLPFVLDDALKGSEEYEDTYNQLAEADDQAHADDQEWQGNSQEKRNGPFDTSFQNEHAIDDGSSNNYSNRTASIMTGSQYIKYREAGIPGRPVEEIDPNATYTKTDEAINFGFVPYAPDNGTRARMEGDYIFSLPSRAANELADARDNLIDYNINYNGEDYSGNELDEVLSTYLQNANDRYGQFMQAVANGDNDTYYQSKEEAGEGAVPIKFGNATWTFDGKDYQVRSRFAEPIFDDYGDHVLVTFPDTGETIDVPNPEQKVMDYTYTLPTFERAENPDEAEAWMATGIDDLKLKDGRTLGFDDALAIYNGAGNRDYGFLNMGKPRYVVEQENEQGFKGENILPFVTDLVLGSAPLFTMPTSVASAVSNVSGRASGIDPRVLDAQGRSRLASSDKMSNEDFIGSLVGYGVEPISERLFGNIGKVSIPGLKWLGSESGKAITDALSNKIGTRAWMPALREGLGVAGEGVEEVIAGTPVEELQQYGLSGMLADAAKDEQGNDLYDESGHLIKNADSDLSQRMANFWAAAPGAMGAGSILGGVMGGLRLPSAVRETRAIKDINRYTKEAGAGVERKSKDEDNWVDVENLRVPDEER